MKLTAKKRTVTGTGASKKARVEGLIPAAIYGQEVETLPVLINRKEFETVIREVGSNGVFEVDVEGDVYQVFVKEQKNAALKQVVYHVDLLAFTEGQKVNMTIPVYITGEESIDVGYASQSLSELEINVAPAEAPAEYTVDVTGLEIGDTVTVADIKVGEGVEVLTDETYTVVSISAPDVEEETVESTDEMPEPEVIGGSDEDKE
ncbi:50S ribosomal protein L25 [Alkalibacterium sp. MB6]|uniref:50S ribosomal protein L25 n=1 Tax=Alkalibacterium sp. MB6 TaxID=2081965 RepID=UPI00137B2429|nr:50S ribosomal protein L25 [Alkalibacterium sp. MB6]